MMNDTPIVIVCMLILPVDLKRDDYYIVTKLKGADHADPVTALQTSLKKLNLSYVDLYLIHSPSGGIYVYTI